MCRICKKTTQQEKNCYFRKKHGTTKQTNKVVFLSEMTRTVKREENYQFVIDSGDTAHMVNNINLCKKHNLWKKK